MEIAVLCIFFAGLVVCLLFDASILYALLFGYALFIAYALMKKETVKSVLAMSWAGVRTVKNILRTFALIGMVTAVWRAGGTIAFIIYYAGKLIVPSAFLLAVFLLCCLVSVLTGTAFGTAATAGIISMTVSNIMGVSEILTGGAILAGSFFGDRCSPMSTSALLVSELTGTDIYENIKGMVKTAVVPFLLSCGLYLAVGFSGSGAETPAGVWRLFYENFNLHPAVLIPALLILTLGFFRVKVKLAMTATILAGCGCCLLFQGMDGMSLLSLLVTGFRADDPALAALMDGGGVFSMARVAGIICLSSCYAGIFEKTGLLDGVKASIHRLCDRTTPFFGLLVTSIATGMATCNQTLSIMLCHQLFRNVIPKRETLAIDMENTTVVIAPLIPWSIACAAPLTSAGAPTASVLTAFYLYLLPLWGLWLNRKKAR